MKCLKRLRTTLNLIVYNSSPGKNQGCDHLSLTFISVSLSRWPGSLSYQSHFHVGLTFISVSLSRWPHFHVGLTFMLTSLSYRSYFHVGPTFISVSLSRWPHFHFHFGKSSTLPRGPPNVLASILITSCYACVLATAFKPPTTPENAWAVAAHLPRVCFIASRKLRFIEGC